MNVATAVGRRTRSTADTKHSTKEPLADVSRVDEEEERDPLWRRTLSMLFTLFIVAGVIYLWPAPLGGKTRIIIVSGHSMEPTYDLGDLVLVRDKPTSEIGDIVVFQVPDGETGEGLLVIHRLLKVDDDGFFITQGDNRDTPDRWQLTEDNIVGQPLAHLPRGGKFFQFIQQLWVVVVMVGLIVIFVLWPDAENDDEDDDEDDDENDEPLALVGKLGRGNRSPADDHTAGDARVLDVTEQIERNDLMDRILGAPPLVLDAPDSGDSPTGATADEFEFAFDADIDAETDGAIEFDFGFEAQIEADTTTADTAKVDVAVVDLDEEWTSSEIADDVMADAMAWLDEQLAGTSN